MKWLKIIAAIIVCSIALLLGLILFQKPSMSLAINGKVIAVVKQPLFRPLWNYGMADVYVGKEKIFSLPENFLDGSPVFIYPFADGKRFLCDYDGDTSLLDFVVDFQDSATNESRSSDWPPNDKIMGDYTRTYMESRITSMVLETKGFVRLPNYAELAEVRSYLTATNSTQTKAVYFNFLWSKEMLLLDLAANRNSVW